MHTTPAHAIAYEHSYLRAISQRRPALSATGCRAWNNGNGALLDRWDINHLQGLAGQRLIHRTGDAIALTAKGQNRLAFWDQHAEAHRPAPSPQLALL